MGDKVRAFSLTIGADLGLSCNGSRMETGCDWWFKRPNGPFGPSRVRQNSLYTAVNQARCSLQAGEKIKGIGQPFSPLLPEPAAAPPFRFNSDNSQFNF